MTEPTESPAIELVDGVIEGPSGRVLDGVSWMIRDRAVTVLVGPAGTGKSTLMRVLAGQALPDQWAVDGTWRFRGEDMLHGPDGARPRVAWCAQVVRDHVDGSSCASVLDEVADLYLLDEPNRHVTPDQLDTLARRIVEVGRRAPVVVITHDLKFARNIATHVTLLVAGRIAAEGDADSFFEIPPSDLAARFVGQGNCWPGSEAFPDLPPHFHWVLPSRLAGMARPGLLGSAEEDLTAIAYARISVLVSLTEEPFPTAELRRFGIRPRHFPIQDMGVPSVSAAARLCREIERFLERNEAVALHCRAGMGRTGTMLAVMLVWMGRSPADAIRLVRTVSPGYIQTRSQEQFVHMFAEVV